jgi:hypothetical protein
MNPGTRNLGTQEPSIFAVMLKRSVIISVVVAFMALVAERPALTRQAASQRPKIGTTTAAVHVDLV